MEITGVTYSVDHYNQFAETGDKNYFEEIIDAMILDGISGMNDTFRNAIRGLSRDKKRMTILSLLDKDLNLFKRIKALTDKNIGKMDHIKDIILMLREYVKVGEVEKKKFGEVMTPLELVKEMLATLPEEVWSNPNLKWLDPANGTGPYPIMVIYKLMIGLAEWEPDAEKRYKHIVENMIYVCELQPKNMFLYMCAVDPFDTYKLNIYTGSFLEVDFDKHMKDVWGVEKFDVVMGNPPYNGAETGGGNSLWDKFIRKSIPKINEDGFLVLVHPASWRKPPSPRSKTKDIWGLLTKENQLLYLEIHSTQDGIKVFNAGTRYDFYCMRKKKERFDTIIIDEVGKKTVIDLYDWNFLPNYNLEKISPLIGEGCEILFSRSAYGQDAKHVSNCESDDFRYKLVHSITKDGPRFLYSSRNDRGLFNVSKVIFGESGLNDALIDMNGDYAMTSHSFAIKVDSVEQAEIVRNSLLSENFKEIIKSCMWGNFAIDWRLFTFFKKDFWNYI